MGHKRVQGSFRKLPSGRWQVRYTGPDGLRYTMDTTFPTRKQADQAWSRLAADLVLGQWASPLSAAVPLEEYAAQWIAERAGLAPRTRDMYESLLRLHIAPQLGQLELRAVPPAVVRRWRDQLLRGGLGASTVAKSYRLLRSVMATAVDDELLSRNPCRLRGAATERPPERRVLDIAQVYALADAIEPRYRLVVLLAVFGSLRVGELMGLQRGDFDLNAMTVHVSRAVSEVAGSCWSSRPSRPLGCGVSPCLLGCVTRSARTWTSSPSRAGPVACSSLLTAGRCAVRSGRASGALPGRRRALTRACTCTTCATPATTWPRPPVPRPRTS